jgi:hypothetical protein
VRDYQHDTNIYIECELELANQVTSIALQLCYHRSTPHFTMTLTESVDTQDVRSRMGTLPDSVAHDDKCTVRPPDPDLQVYKHMFTVDSEAHNNKKQLPSGYTLVSCSAE